MIRLENSRHFLNQPDANLKINCDFVTRAFPRFKLYACFLFKFSLAPRTFSFLLVDCRDYYASVRTGPSIKKCLVSFWEISNVTNENLEDVRRIPRMFRRIPKISENVPKISEDVPKISDRRIFSPVAIFSLTGTPSPQLLTLVTKKMKTRTWPCQMLSVRVGKHFFTAVTLYTLTSVCIFFTLFSIHLLRCWKGDSP